MQNAVEPRQRQWPEYVGGLALPAGGLLLMGYLAGHLGLPVSVGARAVAALYVLNLVPGFLALRFVFRVRPPTPFETMLASFVLGVLIAPAIWHVLCWLGVGAVFFPAMGAAAVALPVAYGWHRHPITRLKAVVTPGDVPIIVVALLFVLLWSLPTAVVQIDGEGVAILPHPDNSMHATLVAELSRGVPAEAQPSLAGAKKWVYHYLPDVWAEMMRRAAGTEPNDAYFYLALPLRYLFLSFAFYLALLPRFGRAGAAVGVVFALGVAGVPRHMILNNGLITYYLSINYPVAFGLAGVALILYCVSIARDRVYRAPLLLASVLAALLLWHKANFALVVVPAVAILGAIVLHRRRDYRWLAVCASAAAMLVAVKYLELTTSDLHPTFLFYQVNYMYAWWSALFIPATLAGLREAVEALPTLVQWPTIYVLCLMLTFHFTLLSVAYLLIRWRAGRSHPEADASDLLTLLILLCCGVGFVVLPIQKDIPYNVADSNKFLVHALLLTVLGPAVWDLGWRIARRGKVAAGATAATVLLALGVNGVALAELWPFKSVPVYAINKSLYSAYRYVRAHTPPRAMILVPDYSAPCVAGLISGRRVVLERIDQWRLLGDISRIEADVRAFYEESDPELARRILNRYEVDYVVADLAGSSPALDGAGLTEVYRKGQAVVYLVDQRPRFVSRR